MNLECKMKKVLFLIVILISLTFVKGDILSINSGGSNELCINPSGEIENCFFGSIQQGPIIIIPGGNPGGGGSVIIYRNQLSSWLCGITYDYAKIGLNNFTEIGNFSRDTVELYTNNWQLICSDLINKSLEEDFICQEIPYYNNYIELRSNLLKKVNMSDYLIKYYVDNYNSICKKTQPLSIVTTGTLSSTYLIYFMFFLLLLIALIIFVINRKRVLKVMKISS